MPTRRSLTALVLLLAAIASFMEPMVGQARDGGGDHRASIQQHTLASASVDAHGDRGATDGPSQAPSPNHRHGTDVDHCTHSHVAALAPTFSLALPAQTRELVLSEPTLQYGRGSARLFHPPRT